MINFENISIYNAVAQFYHEQLFSPKGGIGLEYLKGRGLSIPLLKEYKIGFANNEGSLLLYLHNLGLTPEKMLKTKLITPINRPIKEKNPFLRKPIDYFQSRIIFPIFNGLDVWSFTSRSISLSNKPHLHMKGQLNIYYNFNVFNDNRTIFVTESPIDCLTLLQEYYPTIATMGVDGYKRSSLANFIGKNVFIVFDNDKVGNQKALEFAEELYKNVKVDPFIVTLPKIKKSKMDVNDLYQYCKKEKLNFSRMLLGDSNIILYSEIAEIKPKKEKIGYYEGNVNIEKLLKNLKIDYKEKDKYYTMICPFHDETISSLYWYKDSKRFKCYGCSLSGTIVNFIIYYYEKIYKKKLSFNEALTIAEKYEEK